MQPDGPPAPIGDYVRVGSLGTRYDPGRLAQDGVGFRLVADDLVTLFAHSGAEMRFVAYLEFAPGQTRGNHYHRHKIEYLCLARGSVRGRFHLAESASQVWETTVSEGDLVVVQPGCVHTYESGTGAVALEFSPQPFDEADTYRVDAR